MENQYYGLIPGKELFGEIHPGEAVKARVLRVCEDGKLDLSLREKSYIQMNTDADLVMEKIEEGGYLPFTDKAAPELIKEKLHMSKNAFKRAVGHLLKEGKIKITDKTIERV